MATDIKYQARIDRSNRNNSHTLALDFALNGALEPLSILEVGCSAGYFGAALKQLGHHVCGVEMDPASSAQARQVLDEVHCCTVQAFFEQHAGRQFDVITFGDVLEHLVYPKDVLIEARKHLTPTGRIVCSVPNVAHACVRGALMQGDWNYSDLGILDRTHLRFFTKRTLIELFDEAGFLVQKLQAVRLSAMHAAEMCSIDLQSNTLRLLDELSGDDTQQDFQYVLSAAPMSAILDAGAKQPYASKRALRILATTGDPSSSATTIRLRVPLQAFADESCRIVQIKAFDRTSAEDVYWADVVVIHRGACQHARRVADWCLEYGKPFVYEIDDLLTELPDFLAHHQGYIKNRALIEQLISQANAVTVTNRHLHAALDHLNKSIWICQNYHVQLDATIRPTIRDPHSPVNLIVASSDKVRMDFVSPALVEIKQKYGGKVKIIVIGPIGQVLQEQGVDCEPRGLITYEEFVPTLVKLPNAIGMIPLDDSKFSSCKSPIKYFDYAIGGIATICSDVSPYKDEVTHNVDGMLVVNTTADWVQGLSRLIDDSGHREKLARAARENVARNHSLQRNIDAWTRVFAALAPEGVAISVPMHLRPRKSNLKRLKEYLRQMNHRRKARRREKRRAQE